MGDVVRDCIEAELAMRMSNTFPTGQGILREAATEIFLLRTALRKYGDRARMSNANPAKLQEAIDRAFQFQELANKEQPDD